MQLFAIIAPVFALIALGRGATGFALLEPAALRGLTDFVFFLAMPSLLFDAVAAGPQLDIIGVAGVYFSACLVVFGIGLAVARLLRLDLARGAMLGLNASYGNTVMIGIPIAHAAFGPAALPPLMAIIALHSLLLLPLAGVLVEMGTTGQRRFGAILRTTARSVLRNPIIMSIVLAFAWKAAGLAVPAPLHALLRMLGASGPPLALFSLGASLPKFNRSALGADAVLGTALKLAVLPGVVWVLGGAAHLAPLPLAVATVTAGMPTGANAFLLARRAETLLAISATTVLIGTILSLATLSALLGVLR